MKTFSITDITGLCGIQPHTIRIWESRYTLLAPKRNQGNYRTYSLEDLDYLLKICVLNRAGLKISQLAAMNAENIEQHLKGLRTDNERFCGTINKLIVSMFAMSTHEFEDVLDSAVVHWGIDKTITEIIVPFIDKTRLFSCKDCAIEVDFAIAFLRRKIILGIEKTNPGAYASKTVFLFLPSEEHFDLLLLYSYYLAKRNGLEVLYMGTNVSLKKVKDITEIKRPDHIITYTSQAKKAKTQPVLDFLDALPHKSTLLATGHDDKIDMPNLKLVHFKELPGFLVGIAAA